jgi:hypothetical protein
MSQQEALFLLCGYPVLLAVICLLLCGFWRTLELNYRDSDTKRFPRYEPKPETKPWRKSPDMLDKE